MPDAEEGTPEEAVIAAAGTDASDATAQPEPLLFAADEVLLNAASLARAALREITPDRTIGKVAGHIVEGERTLSLLFENTLPGYPGWFWTVSLSREEGSDEVNVLETELMPGEQALLAPDWVPWSERLAEYQAQQKLLREAAEAAGEEVPEDEFVLAGDEHDDDLDDEDLDEDDDESEDDGEDDGYADDELEEHALEEDELHDELEFDEDDFDESEEIQGAEEAALDED